MKIINTIMSSIIIISICSAIAMPKSYALLTENSIINDTTLNVETNHVNVEWEAYFKNEKGEKVRTLETKAKDQELFLYLRVEIKNEGYFNGKITIKDSNFILIDSENSNYISKIEGDTVYLSQLNVGNTEEMAIKIKPIREESYSVSSLIKENQVKLQGIYRDKNEEDIKIFANQDLQLKLEDNSKEEDVINEMEVVTNKIVEIENQEKRLVQLLYKMGLRNNDYPIQNIESKVSIPKIEEKTAEVTGIEYGNDTNTFDSYYENETGILNLSLKNIQDDEGKISWKEKGYEQVVITCLYDKDVDIQNSNISFFQQISLYNDRKIETKDELTIMEMAEKDSIIEIEKISKEETIYKGKLNANIDRDYETTTKLKINYAKAIQNINVKENKSRYVLDGEEKEVNVEYKKTTINKEKFNKQFGAKGELTVYNQDGEQIGIIDKKTSADQDGNYVIDYAGKNAKEITIKITAPIAEGELAINNQKVIKQTNNIVGNAKELKSLTEANYNSDDITVNQKQTETSIKLENSLTKASFKLNRKNLSTVVANNVEIRAVLHTEKEEYDLYKNPKITITMPEEIQEIKINSVNLLYETELKITNCIVDGRNINIDLEGEQTKYKEEAIKGATIAINSTVDVNYKADAKHDDIQMSYTNEKVTTYEQGIENGNLQETIKIVPPVDTKGQEEEQKAEIIKIENQNKEFPNNQEIKKTSNVGDIARGTKTISGVVWLDEKNNGQKEESEKTLSDIKVKLLNIKTGNLVKKENGEILETSTGEDGKYVLEKIEKGQYIIIFDYDKSRYEPTKYQVEGIKEEENSNAILNEVTVEKNNKELAATNIIGVGEEDIANKNVGFVELENFDLQLDKYVSKVQVEDVNGSIIKQEEYANTKIAKLELDTKRLNGIKINIEYTIQITNKGKIEGYVKKIADYMPGDLQFDQQKNENWYKIGNVLYTNELSETKIAPSETKEVILKLTKVLENENIGLIANMSEIVDVYNEFETDDSNSTPGNRANDENDYGLAEVLITFKTGGMAYFTVIILIVIAFSGYIHDIVKKRKARVEK